MADGFPSRRPLLFQLPETLSASPLSLTPNASTILPTAARRFIREKLHAP